MTTKLFYIEHKIGDDYVEYEYEVEAGNYEPYVPARTSGPPERCSPAEGGYAEINTGGTILRRLTSPKNDATGEKVPWSVFMEGLIEDKGFTDDPQDKGLLRKTALQKAEQFIEDEMAEACEEALRDDYEAAMEARAEAMAERDRDD